MIEIIQNGKDKKYKATCSKCNTDVSYQEKDIETKTRKYDGASFVKREKCGLWGLKTKKYRITKVFEKTNKYITCPCCGEKINVAELKFPFHHNEIGERVEEL